MHTGSIAKNNSLNRVDWSLTCKEFAREHSFQRVEKEEFDWSLDFIIAHGSKCVLLWGIAPVFWQDGRKKILIQDYLFNIRWGRLRQSTNAVHSPAGVNISEWCDTDKWVRAVVRICVLRYEAIAQTGGARVSATVLAWWQKIKQSLRDEFCSPPCCTLFQCSVCGKCPVGRAEGYRWPSELLSQSVTAPKPDRDSSQTRLMF